MRDKRSIGLALWVLLAFSFCGQAASPDMPLLSSGEWRQNVTPTASPLPFYESFMGASIDLLKWAVANGVTIDTVGIAEPSPDYSARFNGQPTGGDELRSVTMDLSSCPAVELSYYYQRKGDGDSPEPGDDLIVEYLNGASAWIEVERQLGDGPDMTTYAQSVVALPSGALHGAFQFRFRNTATSGFYDDWFVDDIRLEEVGDTTPPTVTGRVPLPGTTLDAADVTLDVTFSETVTGVDATDLALSGTAAGGATVGTPTDEGGNSWRFPVAGLADGALSVSLAPDPNDIEDLFGNDVAPTSWDYSVSLGALKVLAYVQYADLAVEYPHTLAGIDTVGTDYTLTAFSDYAQLGALLPGCDVLLVPEQESADGASLEAIGAAWGAVLTSFVMNGGAVVYCDFGGKYGILTGAGLMNITSSASIWPVSVTVAEPGDPVADGVTSPYTAESGSSSYVSPDGARVVAYNGDGVVIHKGLGAGHVVLIGHDYNDSNSDQDRIVGNAVFMAAAGPMDLGDAPDPAYPTLKASNGARHVLGSGLFLGSTVDTEADGLPATTALGDDGDGSDDEDGVIFLDGLARGATTNLSVSASGPGKLDAWVDFNSDGDWADSGEQVFVARGLATGANALSFATPPGASFTPGTYARFRFSSAGGLAYDGAAPDGEVEDYRVAIGPAAPVLDAEPAFTPGATNVVAWAAVPGAGEYRAEVDAEPGFDSPDEISEWSGDRSHEFAGLSDGETYFFRVQARSLFSGTFCEWSQTDQGAFETGTLADAAATADGDVVLAGSGGAGALLSGIVSNPSFESTLSSWTLDMTDVGSIITSTAWHTDGANSVRIVNVTQVNAGGTWGGVSQEVDLTHVAALRFDASTAPSSGGTWMRCEAQACVDDDVLWHDSGVGRTWLDQALDVSGYSGLHTLCLRLYFTMSGTFFEDLHFDNVRAYGQAGYVGSGSITSSALSPSPLAHWGAITFHATTPDGTSLTVAVLPATGATPIPGYEDVASGADLSGIADGVLRLRANLATTDVAATPALHDWAVTWQAQEDQYVEGPWSASATSTQDATAPTVVVAQGVGQADPTNAVPVAFNVAFSEPVSGFDSADDVVLSGTAAGGAVLDVLDSTDHQHYLLMVTAAATDGTLAPTIAACACTDGAGNPNAASTSTDNSVTLDRQQPTVSVEQAAGQADPTNALPIVFNLAFSELPIGFDGAADLSVGGTAADVGFSVANTGDGQHFRVEITSAATDGTVEPFVASSVCTDAAGNLNRASTSGDNRVILDRTPPEIELLGPYPEVTAAGPVTYVVNYLDDHFDAASVHLDGWVELVPGEASTVTGAVTVAGTGPTRTVTIADVEGSGTASILILSGSAADLAGNTAPAAGPSAAFEVQSGLPLGYDALLWALLLGAGLASLRSRRATARR